jgi:hypothetical protein
VSSDTSHLFRSRGSFKSVSPCTPKLRAKVDCISGSEELESDAAELSRKGLALSALPVSTGRSYTIADYCEPVQALGAMEYWIWGACEIESYVADRCMCVWITKLHSICQAMAFAYACRVRYRSCWYHLLTWSFVGI